MKNTRRIKRHRKTMERLFKGLPSWQLNSHGWMFGLVRRGVKSHTALRWLRTRQSIIVLPSGEVFKTHFIQGGYVNTMLAVCKELDIQPKIEYHDCPIPRSNVRMQVPGQIFWVDTSSCIHDLEKAEWCALKLLQS